MRLDDNGLVKAIKIIIVTFWYIPKMYLRKYFGNVSGNGLIKCAINEKTMILCK